MSENENFEEFLKNYKLELTTTINSIKCLFNGVLSTIEMLTRLEIFPPDYKELLMGFWKEKVGINVNITEEINLGKEI